MTYRHVVSVTVPIVRCATVLICYWIFRKDDKEKDRLKAAPVLVKYLNSRQGKKTIVNDKFSDQFDSTEVRNLSTFYRTEKEISTLILCLLDRESS